MATINADLPTLADHASRMDPNGGIAKIVEQLQTRNTLFEEAVFLEGNLPTGHKFTSRTALPTIAWRRFNEGVSPSKSRTAQVEETCGMMEGFSVVDCEEAKLNGNEAAFRASEDKGFVQAFGKEAETAFFYHSTKTAPEKIHGFSPRLDSTTGPGGSQIIKCESAPAGNDQASMWLVIWGPDTVHGIFPKGSVAGLTPHDMGEQLWDDGTGKKFRAYVTNWNMKLGLCVKDWRYLIRICNIDLGSIATNTDTLLQAMVKATHRVQDLKSGRPVFYCNRSVGEALHLQALNAVKNSTLRIDDVGGQPVTKFLGIPVRETDGLLGTESVIS
jgi:hypothetical protein